MVKTAHESSGDRPEAAEPGAADFLSHTREAFRRAAETCASGPATAFFRFAGRSVRIRSAGSLLLEQLRRTFRPLEVEALTDPLELTIDVWDRAETGIGCPGVPFAPESTDALGGGLVTQFGGGSVIRYERATAVAALDRQRREIFFCVADARHRELHSLSKPFPDLLAAWYQDRGVQQLHAGLVSADGQGVLFVGRAGGGKTTCTLVCALDGFDFLGDDNVGVEFEDTTCVGHALYNSARLDAATLERFPELVAASQAPVGRWELKHMVYMAAPLPGRSAARTHLRAIVVPHVVGSGPTELRETTRATVLRSLAPSTLLVPLGGRSRGLAVIGELLRRLPCYELTLGADVDAVPDLVRPLARRA